MGSTYVLYTGYVYIHNRSAILEKKTYVCKGIFAAWASLLYSSASTI